MVGKHLGGPSKRIRRGKKGKRGKGRGKGIEDISGMGARMGTGGTRGRRGLGRGMGRGVMGLRKGKDMGGETIKIFLKIKKRMSMMFRFFKMLSEMTMKSQLEQRNGKEM